MRISRFRCLAAALVLGSCAPVPSSQEVQGEYAYSPSNPVNVAGLAGAYDPRSEYAYLNRLRGPSGESVSYRRLGQCCPFESQNAIFGSTALLDQYEVSYDGLAEPVVLYLNFYDKGEIRPPRGFTLVD